MIESCRVPFIAGIAQPGPRQSLHFAQNLTLTLTLTLTIYVTPFCAKSVKTTLLRNDARVTLFALFALVRFHTKLSHTPDQKVYTLIYI